MGSVLAVQVRFTPVLDAATAARPVGTEGPDIAVTVSTNVAFPVPPAFIAASTILEVPALVGVPDIRPVPVFTETPEGRPVAP